MDDSTGRENEVAAGVQIGMAASDLLVRCRRLFPWEANPFCKGCSWRFVCGGADGWDAAEGRDKVLRAACLHRKAFLEIFTGERAQLLLAGVRR
jgi:hypothetical protein